MRLTVAVFIVGSMTLTGCQRNPVGPGSASQGGAGIPETTAAQGGVVASANGGGHYLIPGLQVQFAFSAIDHGDGRATGSFHHATVDEGLSIRFHGRVTCLAVDSVSHRAWIGGVITKNSSEHPDFTTNIHQPGHDIWFRVLDRGQGQDDADRTTFVGFEGAAGIPTSAEYCRQRIWPADNARTWPVTGNLTVGP